jgi:hypothetical protein
LCVMLLSAVIYAQIGVGLSEAKIRETIRPTDKVKSDTLDDGTVMLRITDTYFSKGYFIKNGVCFMYGVLPLSEQACDALLDICNTRYKYRGSEQWITEANGKILIVIRIYDKDLGEHMYFYTEDEKEL